MQKEYNIPSVQCSKHVPEVAQQLVMDKMADDLEGTHGVAWTKDKLAMDLTFVSR